MNPRISLGGERLRVRISNAYGNRPLTIGAAHIALRDKGPAIVAGSDRKLSFGGEDGAVIAAGAVLFSDPVDLSVPAARRSRGQHPSARRGAGEFRDHRPLCAADQLHLAARQFRRRDRDAGRQSDGPVVFPVRRRCAGRRRGGRDRRARRLADRRQHLDDRRVLPLAGPARPRSRRARRPPGRGHEQRARRQPHPARYCAATAASGGSTATCWRSPASRMPSSCSAPTICATAGPSPRRRSPPSR